MNPKVSVIVPVYNTEKYISECLDSIIAQTLKEIEIIIINDASPDNSIEIINQYKQRDSRIVLIDKTTNEGVGKARNDGIRKAIGEFICFIDSDDTYSNKGALERLYSEATANNVKVAGGNVEYFKDGDITHEKNPKTEYGLTFKENGIMKYSDYQYDYGYTKYIFNRLMIINNNICFPYYSRFQDPPFFVRAMYAAQNYYYIDEPIYRYRILNSSEKYKLNKTMDMIDGVIDNLNFAKEHGLAKLYLLSALRLNTEISFMAIHNLKNDSNYELLSKLIKANSLVDIDWIKTNGFNIEEPFVLDVFKYAFDTSVKYERLRNKKTVKFLGKIFGK